jgi:hypothetical protein
MYSIDTFAGCSAEYTRDPIIRLRRAYPNTPHPEFIWNLMDDYVGNPNSTVPRDIAAVPKNELTDYFKSAALNPKIMAHYGRSNHNVFTMCIWRCYVVRNMNDTRIDEYHVQMYQDLHMKILLQMLISNNFLDASIGLDSRPSFDDVIHEGNLPDGVSLLYESSFLNNRSQKEDMIHQWINKGLPHKCQIRALNAVASKNIQQSTRFCYFFFKLLFCSIIGGYVSNTKRLSFASRCKAYHTYFYYMGNLEKDHSIRTAIAKWHYDNDRFIHYVTKEYILFILQQEPAYKSVVEKKYDWVAFTNVVELAMNETREELDVNIAAPGVWKSIYLIISKYKDAHNDIVIKLPCAEAHKWLIADMADVLEDYPEKCPADTYHKMERIVHTMPMINDQCCYQWLQLFGCDQRTIYNIYAFEIVYKKDSPRYGTRLALRTIYDRAPRQFLIAFEFLKCYYFYTHIKIFDLPSHYIPLQLKALREKWRIQEPDPLPPDADIYYICFSCKSIKTNIIKPEKDSNEIYSFLYKDILYDSFSKYFYCGKNNNAAIGKRGKLKAGGSGVDICTQKNRISGNNACINTKLWPFRFTGKKVVIMNNAYMQCPICLSIFCIDNSKYKSSFYFCKAHDTAAYDEYFSEQYVHYLSKTMNMFEERLPLPPDMDFIQARQYAILAQNDRLCCDKCGKKATRTSLFRRSFLIDDTSNDMQFTEMFFCNQDFDAKLFNKPENIFKSKLWIALDERPTVFYDNRGNIMTFPKHGSRR